MRVSVTHVADGSAWRGVTPGLPLASGLETHEEHGRVGGAPDATGGVNRARRLASLRVVPPGGPGGLPDLVLAPIRDLDELAQANPRVSGALGNLLKRALARRPLHPGTPVQNTAPLSPTTAELRPVRRW